VTLTTDRLLERPAPTLTLRPVTPEDRAAVRGFLAGLSLDSAYRRFFTGIGSPSSALVQQLVEVDHDRREAVLAVRAGQVVGLADCTRLPDGVTVELGVVVADRWQRRGLGPRLARTVLELAMGRGTRRVRMHALADNDPAARLVRRTWPGEVPRRDGTVLAWDLPLPVG
jgi:ribosomal protein S18 acetylase RimI-like enzyme